MTTEPEPDYVPRHAAVLTPSQAAVGKYLDGVLAQGTAFAAAQEARSTALERSLEVLYKVSAKPALTPAGGG